MPTGESLEGPLDSSYEEFITSSLPLYHGPTVKVGVGATRYEVSKALLCRHSPYFAAMFNGKFKEGEEQSSVLEEVEGVVSARSFGLLLQWLYLGRIVFGEEAPKDQISAAIEFARLADMFGIINVESQMAEHIRTTILNNAPPDQTNVYHITTQHVYSATRLPEGHSVRIQLAQAAVEGFLCSETFKFHKEIRDVPEFAADLLGELKLPLKSIITVDGYAAKFRDPFSGEGVHLLHCRQSTVEQ